jgi:uncharacterized protein YecE (DUF72 family)
VGARRIGTSGWHYPSGRGRWNGLLYPATRARRDGTRDFDELARYAELFDTVEVNSTFYGPPRAETTRDWAARTPAGFEFSVKLYQKFTHPKMFKAAALGRAPGSEGALLELLAAVTRSDVDEIRAGLEPLAAAGRLGALLAQFPPSFKADEASRDYLVGLLRAFGDYAVAVELRHRSWSDDLAGTLDLLNAHDAALVQIDEPKFRFSIRQNQLPNVAGFYYMRLHGRNAAEWWRPKVPEDRYNYLYSDTELAPIADTLDAASALVHKAYAYTNNHFAAKSVVNALMLKARLGEPFGGAVPPALEQRYPGLVPTGPAPERRGATTPARPR